MRSILAFTLVVLLPTLAHAGAWTLPAGRIWIKASGLYQFSEEFYADAAVVLPDGTRVEPGESRPYDDDGRSRQRVLFLEVEYGVNDRLTLGVQVPWKELRYEDRIQSTESWGLGDLRSSARVAILTGADRLTMRLAIKSATGRYRIEPGTIPLGENQTDLEVGVQWGRSLGRPLSWVGAEAGHRIRLEDSDREVDPGDEWFWWLEAGWGLERQGRIGLKGVWQGARGDDTSVSFFAPGSALSRDFDEVGLVAMFDLGLAFVELGWAQNLGSETYPSAAVWSLGVSRELALR